ncbi:cold-acclimation family protein [Tripterygium wilfordii]|uniref:Cold-acclimation family protein n=1 Tax=Tripterygium wilfordii TaxID=458696 RepID=A0A7J7DXT3_TRIWF|nr:cold-acclimation family protein [Tripterygium wilfordii]
MSCYCMLFAARTHQSFWWFQEFIHKGSWNIKHSRHSPPVGLSCLGTNHRPPVITPSQAVAEFYIILVMYLFCVNYDLFHTLNCSQSCGFFFLIMNCIFLFVW